ncbi:MAG: xanthine dehydrogenase family protein subunit M [Alphaproteobacteria bacterium]|nr:xanthine dehydrogenase family protein subunit M [Alphaproteobacteria bacterium]
MASYERPTELDHALRLLAERSRVVLAGGTDHFPARVGTAVDEDVLDVSAIAGLRGIVATRDGWCIGATTTWTDVLEADLPAQFDGLRQAAREVGGVQVQNRGTLGGNLCNASPAADGIPALMALDAEVELRDAKGALRVPLDNFVLGNRRTARRPDQLVTAIHVPRLAEGTRTTFLKLGARRYLVISIVMVAATLEPGAGGTVGRARVAIGACSPVARRLGALEAVLAGRPMGPDLGAAAEALHLADLATIDDVRGSAAYRREAALILVRRALDRLAA